MSIYLTDVGEMSQSERHMHGRGWRVQQADRQQRAYDVIQPASVQAVVNVSDNAKISH